MKQNILNKLSDDNNGYLFTAEVLRNGISKTYLGKTVAESGYGNQITVYDKERAVRDAIIDRKKMDVQMFQTAVKEYMRDSDRKLQILVQYAEKLGARDEVMKYVEVLA